MPPQHSPGLLAWLKGPPLSIFLAIARNPGLGPSALGSLSGWGRGATYNALRRLASVGWIERRYRGCWVLTDTGRIALWSLTASPDTPSAPRRSAGRAPRIAAFQPASPSEEIIPNYGKLSSKAQTPNLPASNFQLPASNGPPSDISRVFPEISPSGTNEGLAAPEISPTDTTTQFDVPPDDPSRAAQNPLEISPNDTCPGPAAPP